MDQRPEQQGTDDTFTSRTDLADKITDYAVRYNRTAHPWTWRYDARTDHARYLARHTRTDDPTTTDPARQPALSTAA